MSTEQIGKDAAWIEAVFRGLFFPSRFAVRQDTAGVQQERRLCRVIETYNNWRCTQGAFAPEGLCWSHWNGWKGHFGGYGIPGDCRFCGCRLSFSDPYEAYRVNSQICPGRKGFARLVTVDGDEGPEGN